MPSKHCATRLDLAWQEALSIKKTTEPISGSKLHDSNSMRQSRESSKGDDEMIDGMIRPRFTRRATYAALLEVLQFVDSPALRRNPMACPSVIRRPQISSNEVVQALTGTGHTGHGVGKELEDLEGSC